MLDHSMYPHIVDRIFQFASSPTLLSLRTACRSFRERADAALARHIVVYDDKISPLGISGWHPRLMDTASSDLYPDSGRSFLAPHVRVIDVEEWPRWPMARVLWRVMEAGTVATLRVACLPACPLALCDPRRALLSGPVQCIVHRYRKYPEVDSPSRGYTTVKATDATKLVINMNSSGLFDTVVVPPLEWNYQGTSELVLIFPTDVQDAYVHIPAESEWVNFEANLADLRYAVDRLNRRLTVVNVNSTPSFEAPERLAITPPEGEQSPPEVAHPLERHIRHELLKVFTPGEYAERVSFLTMVEYAAQVAVSSLLSRRGGRVIGPCH